MKKSMLLAMPMLTASPEMKQAAMADEPKKETTYYGHTYTTRTYFAYMNCLVQDGILKAAFFLPDHLRLDGNNPVYEVFLDKENRQFLTYDHLEKKWRDAKLDRLEWHGRNYYATCWVSEEDAALVQDYFSGERGGDLVVALGVAAHVGAQVGLVDGDLDAGDGHEREVGVGDLEEQDVGELDASELVGPSRVLVLLHGLLQTECPRPPATARGRAGARAPTRCGRPGRCGSPRSGRRA